MTEFIAEHPGGDKLLIGAGGPIEPFWSLYAVHKKPYVSFQLPNYKFVEYSCFIKAIHYEVEFPAVIDIWSLLGNIFQRSSCYSTGYN